MQNYEPQSGFNGIFIRDPNFITDIKQQHWLIVYPTLHQKYSVNTYLVDRCYNLVTASMFLGAAIVGQSLVKTGLGTPVDLL